MITLRKGIYQATTHTVEELAGLGGEVFAVEQAQLAVMWEGSCGH